MTANDTLDMFKAGGYFPKALPPVLATLAAAPGPERDAALAAFGTMTRYLKDAMLARPEELYSPLRKPGQNLENSIHLWYQVALLGCLMSVDSTHYEAVMARYQA